MKFSKREVILSKDTYKSFSVMLHISRIFLYSPVLISKVKTNNNYKLRASLTMIFFPYILMFIVGALGVVEMIKLIKPRDDSNIKALFQLKMLHHIINLHKGFTTKMIISLSRYGFAHFIYLMGIISAPLTFKYFWSFFDHIKKVDMVMRKRESIKNRNCNALICITILLFWFPLILENCIHVIGRSFKFHHLVQIIFSEACWQSVYIYPVLLQLNYVSFTYLIYVRLNILTKYLSEILMVVGREENFGNGIFSWNASFVKSRNEKSFTSKNEILHTKVYSLTHIQVELFKAAEEINNLYSFSSMIMIASIFSNLLTASYNLVYHCNLWDLLLLPADAVKIVYEIYCLVLITEIPHRCKKYVKTATIRVLEIISVEPDPETRNQLKILLEGFTYCPLEFGNGFIKIGRNLIIQVTGTVAIFLLLFYMK